MCCGSTAGLIAQWVEDSGLAEVVETTITVSSTSADFDELGTGFLTGIGPAGSYCLSLPPDRRDTTLSPPKPAEAG